MEVLNVPGGHLFVGNTGDELGRGVGDCWENPTNANSKNIGVLTSHSIRLFSEIIALCLQILMKNFFTSLTKVYYR